MKPGTNGSHAAVDPRGPRVDGHSVEERLDALTRMIQAWDWRASVAPGSRSRYVTGSLTSNGGLDFEIAVEGGALTDDLLTDCVNRFPKPVAQTRRFVMRSCRDLGA
jgi:hypothetical protein